MSLPRHYAGVGKAVLIREGTQLPHFWTSGSDFFPSLPVIPSSHQTSMPSSPSIHWAQSFPLSLMSCHALISLIMQLMSHLPPGSSYFCHIPSKHHHHCIQWGKPPIWLIKSLPERVCTCTAELDWKKHGSRQSHPSICSGQKSNVSIASSHFPKPYISSVSGNPLNSAFK